MTLKGIISKVEELLKSDDILQVENELLAGEIFISKEKDVGLLRRYRDLCHQWGTPRSEEKVLRQILSFNLLGNDYINALQDLIYLITSDLLYDSSGEDLKKMNYECIELVSKAIQLMGDDFGQDWANLLNIRATSYLDLARMGEIEVVQKSVEDFQEYMDWIESGPNFSNDISQENILALAQIELAEALFLGKGSIDKITLLLESSILTLESNKIDQLSVDRAYDLLEKNLDKL